MKIILLLLAISLTSLANAQVSVIDTMQAIPIGKSDNRYGALQATLTQYITQGDTTYMIWFYDQQHRSTALGHNIKFKATENDLQNIKAAFLSVFQENKSYSVKINIGAETLTVHNYTKGKNTFAEIRNVNGYVRLTKSGIHNLFNFK